MNESLQACSIELQAAKQRIKAVVWRNRIAEAIPWFIIGTIGICGGWQVNALRQDVYQQRSLLDEQCTKMRQIQDTLTSHNITEAERTERIGSLVSECLLQDNTTQKN